MEFDPADYMPQVNESGIREGISGRIYKCTTVGDMIEFLKFFNEDTAFIVEYEGVSQSANCFYLDSKKKQLCLDAECCSLNRIGK